MNQTSDLIVVGSGGTGLAVDDRLRVLNETDEPIPDLNAGATGAQGGMVIWGTACISAGPSPAAALQPKVRCPVENPLPQATPKRQNRHPEEPLVPPVHSTELSEHKIASAKKMAPLNLRRMRFHGEMR